MVTMIRSDLDFILAQIRIAEADARGEPLLGTYIPNSELPWGLRRVDGSNNNLTPGQENYGAADQPFPHLVNGGTPVNEGDDAMRFGPPIIDPGTGQPVISGVPGVPPGYILGLNYLSNNNYGVHTPNNGNPDPRAIQPGDVVDADPRIISNLIADQTFNNPAAIYKALQLAGVTGADLLAKTEQIKTAFADLKAAIAAAAGPIDLAPLQSALAAAQATAATESAQAAAADTAADQAEANAATAQAAANTAVTNAGADLTSYNALLAAFAPGGINAGEQAVLDFFRASFPSVQIALDAQAAATAAAQTANSLRTIANTEQAQADAAAAQVAAAQTALDNAIAANNTNAPEVVAATQAFEALLEANGIAIEPAVDGNWNKATIFIPNIAPDAGLSAPFNSWMTLFGQFFDHGLDLVAKGGFGTVYIPLQPDDPLYVPGSNTNFMALTRSTLDENGQAVNKVTPFVDQNQTYTSNPSAQVFHREYEIRDGKPVATGRLLNGADGGLATWKDVKDQARDMLGIELDDFDIHNIPEILVDPYGNFIPHPVTGFAQLVIAFGPPVQTISGTPAAPVDASLALKTGHAFLDDIAHNANPGEFDADPSPAGVNMQPEQADADTTISTAGQPQPAGTYDNELLDRHFITGDGRGNENIGLTAIHHVFHSEHNRQIELVKDTLVADGDLAFLNEWIDPAHQLTQPQLDAILALPAGAARDAAIDALEWNGERLFQAAKVATEMQYQHLVFEEFARTVQPFVNVFNDYNGQLDAAIVGEFAHTVYRFGHSMLNETVDRLTVDNQQTIGSGGVVGADQIGLIEAFLNPVEFNAGGLNAEQSAGAIARGMTRQRGNEIDEFVTEALRNNLVGLPLDLAALNIARGRETNVPTLNEARADFYAGSGDAQVRPYISWTDFAANLKNPASVINFIAAYGNHGTITAATTMAEKRDAATKLVLGGAGAPADRLDFLNHRGTYATDTSLGGLNNVDFWIGGLAEKQMAFGGMLGTTFNFVFEVQLENLQNGDRFYYLSRLANLNLTAQLENNKFAEMIARNTDAKHLPGNVFKAMDYQLEVDQSQQRGPDPTGVANGLDPVLAGINGDAKVIRANPDGTAGNYLQFIGGEHVVLGGTEQNDTLIGDEGDDTLWGDGGDDRLEGGIGNDFVFGGEGNDIITDQFGDDEIRSQGGDDVVSAGQGINLIITDTGSDFVWAGDDIDEMLLGQGNDFGAGGADEDMLVGGEGNDWLESGLDNGLMLGDNGDLVQGLPIKRSVDSPVVGHDVLVSTGGNADFDAEQGDDIMVGGLGTERFFGQFGFDWATYKNDPYGIEADMNNRLFAPPTLPASPGAILDRYAQTEALSGSAHTDFLRGDDENALAAGAGEAANNGPVLDHALKDANVALIGGLDQLLGTIDEAGENRFSSGNILLGGAGSDLIEGRGGDDLVDGDRWLDVQIRVNPTPTSTFSVPFLVNGMSEIQERMFSGEIKVAQLEIVRSIKTDGATSSTTALGVDVDIAQFSGARADYAVEGLDDLDTGASLVGTAGFNGFARDLDNDGFITVGHLTRDAAGAVVVGTPGADGSDKLKNVERLMFSDQTIKSAAHANTIATGQVTVTSATVAGVTTLTASLAGIADVNGVPALNPDGTPVDPSRATIYWQVETVPGSGVFDNILRIVADEFAPTTGPTYTLTAAEAGLQVRAVAFFKDGDGAIERVISAGANPGGVNLAPVAPDPAAELGANLQGVVVDGVALPAGTIGVLEDSGAFTFTIADLLANITDPNGDVVSVVGANTPAGGVVVREGAAAGTLTFNQATQTFTFTPAANFNGGVTFEFEATDGVNAPIAAEAILEVIPVNDAPTGIQPGETGGVIGAPVAGAVIAQLASQDVDLNDRPTFTVNAGSSANLAVDANGVVTVVNALGNNAVEVLNLTATDEVGASVNGTIRVLTGPAGAQIINGNNNDDIIFGLGGGDTLNGNGGDDMLIGGAGGDTLNGGLGNDTIAWSVGDGNGGARDVANGGPGGTDTFVVNGDGNAETFRVYSRAEAVAAGITIQNVNSDIVITRNGTNSASVIAELDEIEEIVINTGAGVDTVTVIGDFTPTNLAFNTIHVKNTGGEDTVDVTGVESEHRVILTSSGTGSGNIVGKRPQDLLLDDGAGAGGSDDDENEGNEDEGNEDEDTDQDDTGSSAGGTDGGTTPTPSSHVVFIGTVANEGAFGSAYDDRLSGNGGNDTLFGEGGNDTLVGGDGDDDMFAGAGNDIASGGSGSDRVFADAGNDTVLGGSGNDVIFGGAGEDSIWGDAGNDVMDGGSGNDVFFASGGADGDDVVKGGDGVDTVNYEVVSDDLVVDLIGGLARSLQSGEDALRDIENVVTGSGDDTIYANAAVNVLDGGLGHDTFVFRSAAFANGDRIEGFHSGDKISLIDIFGQSPVVTAGSFNAAGQVRVTVDGEGNSLLEGSTDADADAEFSLLVANYALTQADLK